MHFIRTCRTMITRGNFNFVRSASVETARCTTRLRKNVKQPSNTTIILFREKFPARTQRFSVRFYYHRDTGLRPTTRTRGSFVFCVFTGYPGSRETRRRTAAVVLLSDERRDDRRRHNRSGPSRVYRRRTWNNDALQRCQ